MGIIDEVKSVAVLVTKLKDPEQMEHVMKLQNSVMELIDDNGKLREKITGLQSDIDRLKKEKETIESLTVEYGVYFQTTDNKHDGPYCTRCFDVEKNLVRLTVQSNGYAYCPQCKNTFRYQCRV
jgi:valyl-tRNA synthetase